MYSHTPFTIFEFPTNVTTSLLVPLKYIPRLASGDFLYRKYEIITIS